MDGFFLGSLSEGAVERSEPEGVHLIMSSSSGVSRRFLGKATVWL